MFDFIITNLGGIFTLVSAVIAVASALAALTPNPTDDGIVRTIRKIVDALALNIGNVKKSDA